MGDLTFDIFTKRASAGSIKLEKLPLTTEAAAQHSLRAYLQTRDWLMLQTPSLEILEYGWKLSDQGYAPVPSTDPIAKDYLLKFVSCNCEGTAAHLGAAVKSKESSIFLLAAHVMVTLARISTKQLMRAVREMSGSRVKSSMVLILRYISVGL